LFWKSLQECRVVGGLSSRLPGNECDRIGMLWAKPLDNRNE
jgi:hypothetical protein